MKLACETCISLRGVTAFWTVSDAFLDGALLRALQQKNSFFCVDLSKPTAISHIEQFVKKKSNFYLHEYRLKGSDYKSSLLHSKILLFDFEKNKAEIWIGSHNMTSAAMNGLNVEASVVIKCKKTDEIYKKIEKYLKDLKNKFCHKFDLKEMKAYEYLQSGASITNKVLLLFGENLSDLKSNYIRLLCLNAGAFDIYQKDMNFYIHAYDVVKETVFTYKCQVESLGNVNNSDTQFKAKWRYAFVGYLRFPVLYEATDVNDKLPNTRHYVNAKVIESVRASFFGKLNDTEIEFWNDISKPKIFDTSADDINLKDIDLGDEDWVGARIQKSSYKLPDEIVNLKQIWNTKFTSIKNTKYADYKNLKSEIFEIYKNNEQQTLFPVEQTKMTKEQKDKWQKEHEKNMERQMAGILTDYEMDISKKTIQKLFKKDIS